MLYGSPFILGVYKDWFYKDCVVWTTFNFVALKNHKVLLKQQGGPTNIKSQNRFSNWDHPIILHYVFVFVM